MVHSSYSSPDTSAGIHSDLPESSLWNKSGVSIYNHGVDGHLGIFCCWRQLPKPEILPALPRQGLSSLPPACQITSDSQFLPTAVCVIRGSTTVPFSKKRKKEIPFPGGILEKQSYLDRNSICLAFKKQVSEKDTSVVCMLAACWSHLGNRRNTDSGLSTTDLIGLNIW